MNGALGPNGFVMREALRQLHERAGRPSEGALKRHPERAGHSVAESTLIAVPSGSGGLRKAMVEAFVDGCLGYVAAHGTQLPPADADKTRWRELYDRTYPGARAPGKKMAAAVAAYLARLRQRYRNLDTETLLPLSDQDEHTPVGLREVFVAQTVRADPPAVELPRELWRQLADAGEINPDELPHSVDRDTGAKIRQAYHERPARPVLQVLAEPAGQRLVLLGDPGAGKSTLARYLALTLAHGPLEGELAGLAGWLPLLVELRTYVDPRWRDGTFLDLVEHLHSTDGLGLPKALLDGFLRNSGRAVVVFDGVPAKKASVQVAGPLDVQARPWSDRGRRPYPSSPMTTR